METGQSLELNKENGWTASFEGLYEYKEGQKINYTVKEEDVEGYVSQISGDITKGYVITNKVVLKDSKMGETELKNKDNKNKDNNKGNINKKKVVTPNTIDESNVVIPSLLFVLSLFSLIYLKVRYIK